MPQMRLAPLDFLPHCSCSQTRSVTACSKRCQAKQQAGVQTLAAPLEASQGPLASLWLILVTPCASVAHPPLSLRLLCLSTFSVFPLSRCELPACPLAATLTTRTPIC
jgi:hypothetical protein